MEGEKDLMKGYEHEEPAPIYIHYQGLAFPRVPRRKHLLASHNPHPALFFHPSIAVASQPRPPRTALQAGVFCQTASREGTDRGADTGPEHGKERTERPGAESPSSRANTAPLPVPGV